MSFGLNRRDLQVYAQRNLDDAVLLLEHRRFSNAYFLAGYAVELALKACIAATVTAETIPDVTILKGFMTHEYRSLVALAGLGPDLRIHLKREPELQANWAIASEWSPEVRYASVDKTTASYMIEALREQNSGVMPWIQTHW